MTCRADDTEIRATTHLHAVALQDRRPRRRRPCRACPKPPQLADAPARAAASPDWRPRGGRCQSAKSIGRSGRFTFIASQPTPPLQPSRPPANCGGMSDRLILERVFLWREGAAWIASERAAGRSVTTEKRSPGGEVAGALGLLGKSRKMSNSDRARGTAGGTMWTRARPRRHPSLATGDAVSTSCGDRRRC